MQKIYITGANCFIGHNLVEYFTNKNYEVWALLRNGSLPSFSLKKNINIVFGDLLDKKSLVKSIPENCVVINLAANPYDPVLSYKVNVGGTKNLVEASLYKKVKHFINISSQSTKIRKKGVYAITKNKSDKIVESFNLNYTILKPSLVYGPGYKGLFAKIISTISLIPFVPIFGNGKTLFNPLYIDDLCFLIEKTVNDKTSFFYVDNVLGSTQDAGCDPKEILTKYKYNPLEIKGGMEKIFKPKGINVAIVGLGKMSLIHTHILKTFKGVNIVALIDPIPVMYPSLISLGLDANYYSSFKQAIRKENIDAVFVLSPNFTHFDILKIALENGIHVFSEKPLTINRSQIEYLSKIKTRSIMRIGYTLVFNRVFLYLKRIIENKELGNIKSFNASFLHSEVLKKKNGWMFTKKLSGGGVLMNPGPHLFSLIYLLFGKPNKTTGEIKSLYSTEVEDEVVGKLFYKNYEGKIDLSWSRKNHNIGKYYFNIDFEKGSITADKDGLIIKKGKKQEKIGYYDLEPLIKPVIDINPKANGEAYYIEDRLFIDSIINKNQYKVLNSLEFAKNTESIIFDLYKNSKNDN